MLACLETNPQSDCIVIQRQSGILGSVQSMHVNATNTFLTLGSKQEKKKHFLEGDGMYLVYEGIV